jgi:hypothetical protein
MWLTILSIIAKIRGYSTYIFAGVIVLLFMAVSFYRYQLISLEEKVKTLSAVQEAKVEYIEKVIEKPVIEYKEKIKYIKSIEYVETKTPCENGLTIIRTTGL